MIIYWSGWNLFYTDRIIAGPYSPLQRTSLTFLFFYLFIILGFCFFGWIFYHNHTVIPIQSRDMGSGFRRGSRFPRRRDVFSFILMPHDMYASSCGWKSVCVNTRNRHLTTISFCGPDSHTNQFNFNTIHLWLNDKL